MSRLLATLGVALLASAPVLAWNKAGHMVTGAIAHAVLAEDSPDTLAAAVRVLKAHPQYDRFWKTDLEKLPEADRDLYLFMLAGRWADDVRGNPDYDRPAWHYVNYPFKPAGQPADVPAPPPAEPNIVTAFEHNLARLKTAPDPVEKAVAMTWLFHLTGDVHQPLHSAALFTTEFRTGDRGGNLFHIKATPGTKPINLHRFWDDLITGSDDFRDVRNKATELRLRKGHERGELRELADETFETWARTESFELARDVVYRNGTLPGSAAEFSAPVLPADYAKAVQPVAERRAVLAGYRIAQVLKAGLGK